MKPNLKKSNELVKRINKLKRKHKNFTVSTTGKTAVAKKIKPKKTKLAFKKGGKVKGLKKRKFTEPTFTEVLVTVKKISRFAGKKPNTIVLWQCRVMQEFLQGFLLNMFVMPELVYKYVESELEDCGIYTKPAVITNYDHYRRGIKMNRLPKGLKTQSIKTLVIETI